MSDIDPELDHLDHDVARAHVAARASRQLAHYQACALELARVTTGLIPQLRSIAARVSLEDQMVLDRIIAAAESVADAANGRTRP